MPTEALKQSKEEKRQKLLKAKEGLVEKREEMKAREQKIDERLRRLDQPSKQERARDTKRKIIAGAIILKMIKEDEDLLEKFKSALLAVAGEGDKKLFLEYFGDFKEKSKEAAGEKIYLNVPYEEKDEAKGLGAQYDPAAKRWFIIAGKDDPAKYTKWA